MVLSMLTFLKLAQRNIQKLLHKVNGTAMKETSQIKTWEKPETGIRGRAQQPAAYYYVRVIQRYSAAEPDAEGEIAWSSPIFVYRGN